MCLLHDSISVGVMAKLLQRQFSKDQALAWKFEVVRRRDQLSKAEAEAQVSPVNRCSLKVQPACWMICCPA